MIRITTLASFFALATVAQAQSSVLQLAGEVSDMTGPPLVEFPNAQIGDALVLRIALDASTPSSPYAVDLAASSLRVGDEVHHFDPALGADSFVYSPCDHGFDWFTSQFTPTPFLEMGGSGATCALDINGGSRAIRCRTRPGSRRSSTPARSEAARAATCTSNVRTALPARSASSSSAKASAR